MNTLNQITVLICPDPDATARNSLGENNVLIFCSRTNGTSVTNVNIHNFVGLVKKAVKHIRFKRELRAANSWSINHKSEH